MKRITKRLNAASAMTMLMQFGGLGGACAQASSALGWRELANTKIRSVCPDPNQYPNLIGGMGCEAVTLTWSGGAFDTKRNRLLIRGGGHNGYFGNEIYALNLNPVSVQRLFFPNYPSAGPMSCGCPCNSYNTMNPNNSTVFLQATDISLKPTAEHTYNHLAYLPDPWDRWFEYGGGGVPCGGIDPSLAWTMNMSNNAWTSLNPSGTPVQNGTDFNLSVAYDPNSGKIFARGSWGLSSFDLATNTWTPLDNQSVPMSNYKTAVIDPKRKLYILFVNDTTDGGWFKYDISPGSGYPISRMTVTGCAGIAIGSIPGMEYDPVEDRVVLWAGGNTVYLFNPDTNTCTTVTPPVYDAAGSLVSSGSPPTTIPAAIPEGTYGRFRYVPSMNAFLALNSVDDNAYLLRLDNGSPVASVMAPAKPTGLAVK